MEEPCLSSSKRILAAARRCGGIERYLQDLRPSRFQLTTPPGWESRSERSVLQPVHDNRRDRQFAARGIVDAIHDCGIAP
jgi:hypothetical protein